ncbi:MAG: precorrin-3B synthase [Leptolyngbya sp. BL-A-14]
MSSKFASLPSAICPGLFVPSIAQDGLLYRLRVPGGLLTVKQCEAIADLADQAGSGFVEVTNRANVQIRGLQAGVPIETLERLQAVGLASPIAAVDSLRNIMGSPTAGIDRQQLLDTRPLVAAWNHYLTTRPDFAVLSPKFSVCFDGGEAVSVRDRPNDIGLVAVAIDHEVWFRLHLNLGERGDAPCDVGVLVKPQDSLPLLTAITEVYCDYTNQTMSLTKSRKPRLRELFQDWGVATFLQKVGDRLPFSLEQSERTDYVSQTNSYQHLGAHPQQQPGFSYLGVVLPLGRLRTHQWQGLATLAAHYGNGFLRLTPWQTVLLADISTPQIEALQQAIERLGLNTSATHPQGAIVACSGLSGCKASATDTQENALTLANHLAEHLTLDRPINIHFSGCEKSCAQHHASDIALLGIAQEGEATYQIYVGDNGSKFGRSLDQTCASTQLPAVIEQIIRTYQAKRFHPNETFRDFVNRHEIMALKQLFNVAQMAC